jgi:hypothetical protein
MVVNSRSGLDLAVLGGVDLTGLKPDSLLRLKIKIGAHIYDIAEIFAQHERHRYAMHSRHLNEQMVRVLKRSATMSAFTAARDNISDRRYGI